MGIKATSVRFIDLDNTVLKWLENLDLQSRPRHERLGLGIATIQVAVQRNSRWARLKAQPVGDWYWLGH